MDQLQSIWQLLQPYAAGRIRHLLAALAGAFVAKHVIQPDQQSAFVDIGFSIVCYVGAEVWSVVAARTVPFLLAERDQLKAALGRRVALQRAMDAAGQSKPPAPSVGKP